MPKRINRILTEEEDAKRIAKNEYQLKRYHENADRERARSGARYAANPEKERERTRRYGSIRRYKLDQEKVDEIISRQNGKCPICDMPLSEEGGRSGRHIDHDHSCCPKYKSCGKCVRGILCQRCNVLLGYAMDNQQILTRAIEYLDSYKRVTEESLQ